MLTGLAHVNIELTSRCNKNCWMCGRRKRERENGPQDYGDMPLDMVAKIAVQIPPGVVVQLHNNGEPLLYPQFGEALAMFQHCYTSLTTNGKLLVEKADEIHQNLYSIAVSVFPDDPEADEQFETVREFVSFGFGFLLQRVIIRALGDVDTTRYEDLGLPVARRLLHAPDGSRDYRAGSPTIPEIGVCLDLLHSLAIDRYGNVSCCVRYDPEGKGILGNVMDERIATLWNSDCRHRWIDYHLFGERWRAPLCATCDYWGVPTGRTCNP